MIPYIIRYPQYYLLKTTFVEKEAYNYSVNKKSLINALSASVYIVLVVSLFNFIMQTQKDKPDTIAAPITVLSVLTLSVAVMSYLFFYQPIMLFIEGKKKLAVNHFLQTVVIFAALTALSVILLFSGLLR